MEFEGEVEELKQAIVPNVHLSELATVEFQTRANAAAANAYRSSNYVAFNPHQPTFPAASAAASLLAAQNEAPPLGFFSQAAISQMPRQRFRQDIRDSGASLYTTFNAPNRGRAHHDASNEDAEEKEPIEAHFG